MLVTNKGQRLSIQPVEEKHFSHVLDMVGNAMRHGLKKNQLKLKQS
jgi:predicted RNA-binding protein with PUA-like domain